MISTITAKRPVYRPWVKSTTRPTSTNLHCEAVISMSAFSAMAAIAVSIYESASLTPVSQSKEILQVDVIVKRMS